MSKIFSNYFCEALYCLQDLEIWHRDGPGIGEMLFALLLKIHPNLA